MTMADAGGGGAQEGNNMLRNLTHRLDDFQQRRRVLAFPVAVWKKFGDDQAGNLAALLAFFAFLSIFPLLLVFITILGMVLHNDPAFQKRLLDSAFADFPVVGTQLRENIHGIGRSGFGLAVGIVGSLLGARGFANAAQNALNHLWAVPFHRRPGFPISWLRAYGVIAVLGLGVLATSALSAVGTWAGGGWVGGGVRVLVLLASWVVDICLFWLGLRLATAAEIPGRDLWIGAILAATIWQILQLVGGYIVAHQLRHASALYGVFGLVLGLIAWLYLQATLTLYAVEIDVVRSRRLWPRSLFPPPLTGEDARAYRSYTKAEERVPNLAEQPIVDMSPPAGERVGRAGRRRE